MGKSQGSVAFDEWIATLPDKHWAKYDISACRLGWDACSSRILAVCPNPTEQSEQLWEMKQRACRAHELCNALRLAFPEIPELGDDGTLHEAIHDILRVDTPTAAPAQATQADVIGHPRGPDEQRDEIELYLRDAYAAGCLAAQSRSMVTAMEYAHREAPKLRAIVKPTAETVAQGEAEWLERLKDPATVHALMLRGVIAVPSIRSMVDLHGEVPNGEEVQLLRIAELQEQIAAQPRAVPDAYVGELIEAATEVYRISDREHEAWRRLRAALVAARKAQRPRVGDAAVEPVTQGEQISPPRYSYGADDSVMLLNPEDSTYTRGVPDRWKFVPVEPTPKMLAAVSGMEISVRVAEDDTAEYPVPEDDCAEIYRTMLAAAPSPESDHG